MADEPTVKLYLGDCLDILPTLGKVDAVVTDPPYGIDFKYATHEDAPEDYERFMRVLVERVQAVVEGPVFMWQAMLNAARWHRWLPDDFRIFAACKGFVQWRPVSVQYSWDPVIFWGKTPGQPSVYRKDYHEQRLAPFGANRETIDHPCPRPLEQVIAIVELATVPGQLVLDPFMGSGTTGVACVRTSRRFIGIEIDPTYYAIAEKRIAEAQAQPQLPAFRLTSGCSRPLTGAQIDMDLEERGG